MGRKDAGFNRCLPVEQYRKQIGKQDWKKSKRDVKNMKSRADNQTELTPQKIVLWLGLAILTFSSAYCLLFWYMGAAPLDHLFERPPT